MSVCKRSRLKRAQQGYFKKFHPLAYDTSHVPNSRRADSYRAARRNDCKKAHGIWGKDWYYGDV